MLANSTTIVRCGPPAGGPVRFMSVFTFLVCLLLSPIHCSSLVFSSTFFFTLHSRLPQLAIYLLGGVSLTSVFSDLWRLDLATYTWIDVGESIGGEAPPPSFFHSVVCTRTGELIKFGGVLDLDSRTRTNSVHKLDICPGSVSSLLNMCCEYLSREDVLTPSALVRSELPMVRPACPRRCLQTRLSFSYHLKKNSSPKQYFVDAVLPYLPPSTSSFCAA